MGGQAAQRGYLLQALTTLLESLEDSSWDHLAIEPNEVSEKIDIQWHFPDRVKVEQVKHSKNTITVPAVKAWAEDIERSMTADNYRLILIGPCAEGVTRLRQHGKVEIPPPMPLRQPSLNKQHRNLTTTCIRKV